jgi:DNA polymerase V
MTMIRDILRETGITATAGIGTNLYLAKIAMDIVAKHKDADENGVRIAELDERSYREKLWSHTPITDFWRVGHGYAKKLRKLGIVTMGDVARCSVLNEDVLYRLFGVNAELLIDHAWGWEPCTIAQIKAYKPSENSIGEGQVLHCAYTAEKGKLIVMEMMDKLVYKLVDRDLVTDHIVITVGYDMENLEIPQIRENYKGEITMDWYGRPVPKPAHGSVKLDKPTSSSKVILDAAGRLYDRIVDPVLMVRRMFVTAAGVIPASEGASAEGAYEQLDLFTDYEALEKERTAAREAQEREKRMQKAVLEIRKRFGSNAIVKGMNLEEGATAMERNSQIGGHKA